VRLNQSELLPIIRIVSNPELSSTRLAAGTVVTADYLPWVRVTAASFLEHHPDAQFRVLVIDDYAAHQIRDDDGFTVLRPADVGLTASELGWMQLIYTPLELCCALKPWLVRRLLDTSEVVFYIDADICVYGPLTDLADEAQAIGLVLTPHSLIPREEPDLPNDDALLQFGQFNGGFMVVGRVGRPFVDWWAERCARECTDWNPELPRRYLDQRWLDLAIGYFPVTVIRDPGINLARWNLFQRDLESIDGRFTVNGVALRCFHFSAFDPSDPDQMWGLGYAHPHNDPAQSPPLRALLGDYARRLIDAGWTARADASPPASNGMQLAPPVRAAIRTALIEAERLEVAPVNAGHNQARIMAWLRMPVSQDGLSWYLWGLREAHATIRAAFPQVPGSDESRYISWASNDGVSGGLVPTALAGAATRFSVDGTRKFVAVLEVDEVLTDPTLLDGVGEVFTNLDEVTLLLRAPGHDPETLVRNLQPVLLASGLNGPSAPDLLAVVDPVPPQLLAGRVHAVFTHRAPNPAFAGIQIITSSQALREAS